MSSIRSALERLDNVVGKLDASVLDVEHAVKDCVPVSEMIRQVDAVRREGHFHDSQGNVVDVDFVARRLDSAIETVENLLK
ncbi:MAG: hypothetical protein ACLFP8_01755 [Alphaproteobacteria bacterium]